MSEELKPDVPEVDFQKVDQEVKQALQEEAATPPKQEVQYSEAEQKAMDMGWNPDLDALEGSGKQWIPADEFLRNQTFFSEIKNLKKQVKQQQKVTEAFKEQNKIIQERAYERAYKELREQKVAAAEDRDLVKMLELDEQITNLDKHKKTEEQAGAKSNTLAQWDDAYEEFLDKNSWYTTDDVRQAYADKIGQTFLKSNPTTKPEALYTFVEKEVQRKFETRGQPSPPKPKASAVAAPTRSGSKASSTKTMADLPDEHRSIARTLIKSGELSEADYLKQYFTE